MSERREEQREWTEGRKGRHSGLPPPSERAMAKRWPPPRLSLRPRSVDLISSSAADGDYAVGAWVDVVEWNRRCNPRRVSERGAREAELSRAKPYPSERRRHYIKRAALRAFILLAPIHSIIRATTDEGAEGRLGERPIRASHRIHCATFSLGRRRPSVGQWRLESRPRPTDHWAAAGRAVGRRTD